MKTITSLADLSSTTFPAGTAVAIGKFDGVHRGHRALLERIARAADAGLGEPVVLTFENNPLSVLRPESCPPPIMSRAQRLEALDEAGAAVCVMIPFDERLAEMPAESFVRDVLVGRLRVRHVCVGRDFRFGNRGAGDVVLLTQLGDQFGFSVEVVGDVVDPGLGRVSSSNVRAALLAGEISLATGLLGRYPSVRGVVVHGDARGRDLGFPTANLGGEIEGLPPVDGVYAGWAVVDGARYQAAVSVGRNVTFDPAGEVRVEAFLMDFSGDLYGKTLEIQFVAHLRGMIAFDGVDALVARMHEDVAQAREILSATAA